MFPLIKKVSLLLIGALILSGCAKSSQSSSDFSSNDITFAEMMIPHHEQAIEMSELAFQNTSNSEVLKIAQEIGDSQSPAIELMKSWTGVKESTHAGHLMEGMLSEVEISELRAAKNDAFDLLFLEGMIKHHRGAIEMAKDAIYSDNIEVANLSASIMKTQEIEITLMQDLLLAQ